GDSRLLVHANAPSFHLLHVERWPRIMGYTDRLQFAERVSDALRLVEKILPGFTRQAGIALNTCVPMITPSVPPLSSGSYTRLFGAVFLSSSPDQTFTAEMLIHEFAHNKLSLLEDVAPFFRNFSRKVFR